MSSIERSGDLQAHGTTSGKALARPSWRAWLLLLLVAAALLALSHWQWSRAAEKEALLTRYGSHSSESTLSWAQAVALGDAAADRPVLLSGHFLPGYRVALDNQMRDGVAGYHLYYVFQPDQIRQAVLVNMGWLPTDRDGGPAVPVNQVPNTQQIRGNINFPSHWLTVGEPELTRGLWRAGRIEPAHWAALWHLSLVPWTVRLSPTMPFGYLRDWAPSANLTMGPERHRAYAFQWAAMAVAWCVCWVAFWRRQRADNKS